MFLFVGELVSLYFDYIFLTASKRAISCCPRIHITRAPLPLQDEGLNSEYGLGLINPEVIETRHRTARLLRSSRRYDYAHCVRTGCRDNERPFVVRRGYVSSVAMDKFTDPNIQHTPRSLASPTQPVAHEP